MNEWRNSCFLKSWQYLPISLLPLPSNQYFRPPPNLLRCSSPPTSSPFSIHFYFNPPLLTSLTRLPFLLAFSPSLPSSHTSLLPLFSPIKSIPIDANFFYCLSTSTNSSTTFATWSSSTTISSSLSISTFSFSSTSFLTRDQPNIRFWHYFRWINLWLFCVVSDILHYTATVLLLGLQLDLPVCVYRPTINLTTA